MAAKTNYTKNGQNYYRITATVGKNADGKPIRKEFYGKSKKDAEEKRDEYIKNINQGLTIDYNNMTISELMHSWLYDVVRVSKSYNTFDRYECVYRNYIKNSPHAVMKVYEIKSLILQKHYNSMSDSGKTYSQIFNLNKLLKTFFNYAIRQGYIIQNPTFRIAIPKTMETPSDENEVDPFTDEEISKIKENLKDDMLFLFSLSLGTGMRKGELLALRYSDFDFNKNNVSIENSLKKVKKINGDETYEYVTLIDTLKTKGSKREVPLPSALISPLKSHIKRQKEKFFKHGLHFKDDSLIFTTEGCFPIDGKNLLRAWGRSLKRAGVRYRKFHNIRHTYATKLFQAGVPLKTVSVLLGHTDIGMTANTYTHVIPKQKDDAAEKLNYLFN